MKQRNETKHARQTETALNAESDIAIDALGHEDRQTHELGRLLRQSANIDLPASNDDLRQKLTEQLKNAPATENELAYTDGRLRRWAIAASLLLALGVCSVFLLDIQGKFGSDLENEFGKLVSTDLTSNTEPSGTVETASFESSTEQPTASEGGEKRETAESLVTGGKGKDPGVTYEAQVQVPATPSIANKSQSNPALPKNPDADQGDFTFYLGVLKDPPKVQPTKETLQRSDLTEQLKQKSGEELALTNENAQTQFGLVQGGQSDGQPLVFPDPIAWAAKKQLRTKWLGPQRIDNLATLPVDGRFAEQGLGFCGVHVQQGKNTEQYKPIHENEFVAALGGKAISTFSIDVDTASYANMRRFVNAGQIPPRDSVRIEELVNYFTYDYPQPTGDDPFSVNMELATCPWNIEHKLLRVGLKGKDVNRAERPATNLVFLLDVSGSMNSQNKLPLLKQGFQMMVKELTENDTVTIVTYAGNAGVALEPTNGTETKKINEAIASLNPGGSTHGSAGIELAYKLAQKHLIKDGVNKVILATDGDLNVGVTDDGALVKLIKEKASEGVFLTVLGFGTGNLKDGKMEQLADNGNGMYAYIDSIREARKVLVEQMSGSLVTIAKDVKLQIEFNPAEVAGYRLIGYENRMLATKDFDDDTKDAGEIGAGHTVTALYEIVTTDKARATTLGAVREPMKYQTAEQVEKQKKSVNPAVNLSDVASNGELLTLALRYKKPDENVSKRIEFSIKNDEKSFSSASEDFQFAASVASFGMLLRGSRYAGNATFLSIQEIASGCLGEDKSGYRSEFLDLVRKAAENRK